MEISISLKGLDHRILDMGVGHLVKIFLNHGYFVKGPIPLPTRRSVFTILSSPFVFKNAREQLQKCMHARLLRLQ
jgi:small subunit ribosomal protein S10